MKISGIEGLDTEQLKTELDRGGKFVVYRYCISLIIITLQRSSNIYFLKYGDSGGSKIALFSLLSILFGWWGFPWGPIHTIGSLITNFRGGKDITQEVVQRIVARDGQ